MSELRFALLSTAILILSYTVALSVSSLERVLAYVGATGSTSISFILPGLFYYKISDPDSIHHQRLAKDEDDPISPVDSDDEDEDPVDNEVLGASVDSLRSTGSSFLRARSTKSRWRTKWRWDMEHIDPAFLRRAALALAIYGFCVMAVCLGMNLFGSISAH